MWLAPELSVRALQEQRLAEAEQARLVARVSSLQRAERRASAARRRSERASRLARLALFRAAEAASVAR